MGCIWKYDIQIADMTMESKVRVTANKICLIAGNLNSSLNFGRRCSYLTMIAFRVYKYQ